MNILIGVHQFFPDHRTGTEVLTLELARGLRNRGHNIQILTTVAEKELSSRRTPWMSQDKYDDFVIYRLHYGTKNQRDPISLHFDAPDRVHLVKGLVTQLKPDTVHFNHIIGFSAKVIPEIRLMQIPVIFTPTDFWTVCPMATLYRTFDKQVCNGPGDGTNCVRCFKPMPYWAAKLALKVGKSTIMSRLVGNVASVNSLAIRLNTMIDSVNAASKVLPATQFLADMLVRHGVDQRRVKVVRYGIDVGRLPEKIAIPEHFSEERPLQLGFIGTLSEIKGCHVILEALSLLEKQLQKKVTLSIYGKREESEPYCADLQNKANELGGIVQFREVFDHEKIGEVLRGLHMLVVPSLWYESTPLVLCSALNTATPVLISKLDGMTEAVNEGINGFSFAAGHPRELSRMIIKFLNTPEFLISIHQSSRGKSRTTNDYVNEIESEYLDLVSCSFQPTKAVLLANP